MLDLGTQICSSLTYIWLPDAAPTHPAHSVEMLPDLQNVFLKIIGID